jgi:NAD(P)H-hydrate epimerase
MVAERYPHVRQIRRRPMKVLSCGEMALLDERAQKEYHIPGVVLMENAARSAADYLYTSVLNQIAGPGPVVFAVGKGNNGGDALAMARHLSLAGVKDLRVLLAVEELGPLPSMHRDVLKEFGMVIEVFSGAEDAGRALLGKARLIIDGLFGIGLSGPSREPYSAMIAAINGSRAKVVSLDVPSGLGDSYRPEYPAVKADLTLSFELPKICQYRPAGRLLCGQIVRIPVGFPPALIAETGGSFELSGPEVLDSLLRDPPPGAYKNSRGHVAVFAGAPGTTGAAALATEAALRSGAGLVSLFADEPVYPLLAAGCRSVMVRPWSAAASRDPWPEDSFSAFLLGPGWGRDEDRYRWFRRILMGKLPGVLDADGLYLLKLLLSREKTPIDLKGRVLTPHPGEFAALMDLKKEEVLSDPIPAMAEICGSLGCVLVLKGHVTFIGDPGGRTRIHDGMNPALGTAGSGDILAGIIAGFLGRGMGPLEAALCGVELHGKIGKQARADLGFFTSEDLLRYISREALRDAETK